MEELFARWNLHMGNFLRKMFLLEKTFVNVHLIYKNKFRKFWAKIEQFVSMFSAEYFEKS